jgi:hypothetical protein
MYEFKRRSYLLVRWRSMYIMPRVCGQERNKNSRTFDRKETTKKRGREKIHERKEHTAAPSYDVGSYKLGERIAKQAH